MKKYLIIGNHIEHSLSPKLHNYWIKENHIKADYKKKKTKKKKIKKKKKKRKKKEEEEKLWRKK